MHFQMMWKVETEVRCLGESAMESPRTDTDSPTVFMGCVVPFVPYALEWDMPGLRVY